MKNKKKKLLSLLISAFILSSCAAQVKKDYTVKVINRPAPSDNIANYEKEYKDIAMLKTENEKMSLERSQDKAVIKDSKGQMRVGVLLPLSGKSGKSGLALKNAALMAMEDFSSNNIILQFYDTGDSPSQATYAAQKAISQGVRLFIGPVFSEQVEAVSDLSRSKGISVISFSTKPEVLGSGVYTVGLLVDPQIERILTYASQQNLRNLAIIAPEGSTGEASINAALRVARTLGINITNIVKYYEGGENISEKIKILANYESRKNKLDIIKGNLKDRTDEKSSKLLKALDGKDTAEGVDFDSILIVGQGTTLKMIASTLAYYDVSPGKVKYLGTTLWDDESLKSEPSLNNGWYPALSKKGVDMFNDKYKDIFGSIPPKIASLAYDAVALAAVISSNSTLDYFSEEDLTDDKGFVGINGIFRLFSNGFCERGLDVMEIHREGDSKVLSPAPTFFQSRTVNFSQETEIPQKRESFFGVFGHKKSDSNKEEAGYEDWENIKNYQE